MKIFRLVVIFFSTLLATVSSQMTGESTFACDKGCTNKTCMFVKCGLREGQCQNGVARDGAGMCGCCNNCIIPLRQDDPCEPLPGYGVPNPVFYCDYGLTCDCVKKICVPCSTCVPQDSWPPE